MNGTLTETLLGLHTDISSHEWVEFQYSFGQAENFEK